MIKRRMRGLDQVRDDGEPVQPFKPALPRSNFFPGGSSESSRTSFEGPARSPFIWHAGKKKRPRVAEPWPEFFNIN